MHKCASGGTVTQTASRGLRIAWLSKGLQGVRSQGKTSGLRTGKRFGQSWCPHQNLPLSQTTFQAISKGVCMPEIHSRIPVSYQDAVVRCVLPVCTATGRIAIAVDTQDGQTLRIALSQEHAAWLAGCLTDCISSDACTQSPGSALMPSAPKSVPSGGSKV